MKNVDELTHIQTYLFVPSFWCLFVIDKSHVFLLIQSIIKSLLFESNCISSINSLQYGNLRTCFIAYMTYFCVAITQCFSYLRCVFLQTQHQVKQSNFIFPGLHVSFWPWLYNHSTMCWIWICISRIWSLLFSFFWYHFKNYNQFIDCLTS